MPSTSTSMRMYGNTAVIPQPMKKAHQNSDSTFNWTLLSLVLVAYLYIIAGLTIKEANTTLVSIKMILEGLNVNPNDMRKRKIEYPVDIHTAIRLLDFEPMFGYVNSSIPKRVKCATQYFLVPMAVHSVNTPPKTCTDGFRVSSTEKEQEAYWQPL
ncbi:hypothetical protein H4Q26_007136 [Puccinia striiformis f. sp. tritici PST-130]|nr:hypothetical protein H4Q26_007136 [Puccinia striiformis f. sp. tritici PST-130]